MRWFEHDVVAAALAGQLPSHMPAKKVLLAQDDITQNVYILRKGDVKISYYGNSGRITHIALLHAPDSFGELAALDGLPRSATVETHTACQYHSLTAQTFNVLLQNSELSHLMMLELANRVRNIDKRLIDSQNFTVLERFAQDILQHADKQGRYHITLSQETWAQTLDVSRETLARNLSYFEKEQTIARHGKEITILDYKRLQQFAGLG